MPRETIRTPSRLGPDVRLAIETVRSLPTARERVAALAAGYPAAHFQIDLKGQVGVEWLRSLIVRASNPARPAAPQEPKWSPRSARWAEAQRADRRAGAHGVPGGAELAQKLRDGGVPLALHAHTRASNTIYAADGKPEAGDRYSSRCTYRIMIYTYAAEVVGIETVRGATRYLVAARDSKGKDAGTYIWLEKQKRFSSTKEGALRRVA